MVIEYFITVTLEDIWLYDISNYPKDHVHPLYNAQNKKVLGKMKEECEGRVIKEVAAIRPKMYSGRKTKKIS